MYKEYLIEHEETKHVGDITKKELKKIILDSLEELKEE